MKGKIIFGLLLVAALVDNTALAISQSYRAQLERSGCTQVTDDNGCDIHKSRAENERNERRLQQRHGNSLDQLSSEIDTIIGADYGDAVNYLYEHGWRSAGLETYKKAGWKMRVIIQSGKIANAQIIGH